MTILVIFVQLGKSGLSQNTSCFQHNDLSWTPKIQINTHPKLIWLSCNHKIPFFQSNTTQDAAQIATQKEESLLLEGQMRPT